MNPAEHGSGGGGELLTNAGTVLHIIYNNTVGSTFCTVCKTSSFLSSAHEISPGPTSQKFFCLFFFLFFFLSFCIQFLSSELGEAIGELAKPSARSTRSAAAAINITAQIDV